ncbi:MAG: metalloregulator ArsR/SmtB family transcription factor [Pseudomonadota bacterium]
MNDSIQIRPGEAALPLDPEEAAEAFAALGSEARLNVIRLLVRAGPDGMTVGALKEATGAAGSTLSHHLRFLTQTGLMSQEKVGRTIICRADFERVQSLADYLTRECCADGGALAAASNDQAETTT